MTVAGYLSSPAFLLLARGALLWIVIPMTVLLWIVAGAFCGGAESASLSYSAGWT